MAFVGSDLGDWWTTLNGPIAFVSLFVGTLFTICMNYVSRNSPFIRATPVTIPAIVMLIAWAYGQVSFVFVLVVVALSSIGFVFSSFEQRLCLGRYFGLVSVVSAIGVWLSVPDVELALVGGVFTAPIALASFWQSRLWAMSHGYSAVILLVAAIIDGYVTNAQIIGALIAIVFIPVGVIVSIAEPSKILDYPTIVVPFSLAVAVAIFGSRVVTTWPPALGVVLGVLVFVACTAGTWWLVRVRGVELSTIDS